MILGMRTRSLCQVEQLTAQGLHTFFDVGGFHWYGLLFNTVTEQPN